MKIKQDTVRRLTITEVPSMSPIRVMLEDIQPGMGRITIECDCESWSAIWSGMGEGNKITQFVSSCDSDYIAGKVSSIRALITDLQSIVDAAQRKIIAGRWGHRTQMPGTKQLGRRLGRSEITRQEARELWDEVACADFHDEGWNDARLMEKVFGDEWWYSLPTRPNPEYTHLISIIRIVQDALKVGAA